MVGLLLFSGVSQGYVLGPLYFNIFIYDRIDDGVLSKIYKFADGTKLYRAVSDEEEAEI